MTRPGAVWHVCVRTCAQRPAVQNSSLTLDVRALAPGGYVLELGSGAAAKRIAVVVE